MEVSLALVNLFIRNAVKLSFTDTCESSKNFLLGKTFLLSLYQKNLMIPCLGLAMFFRFPVLCNQSTSLCVVFVPILVSMTSIAKTSVLAFLFSHISWFKGNSYQSTALACLSLQLYLPLFRSDKSLILLNPLYFFSLFPICHVHNHQSYYR